MPVALVTGATGLVGSHIIERLVRDGWTARALVRDAARAEWLRALGAELVSGDVLDADSMIAAARGCTAIFHTAALIAPTGGWNAFHAVNIGGTGNAISAAERSGARLLQVSSVAVYGSSQRYRSTPTDESIALPPIREDNYYARSKRESEELVMSAHRSGRIWAVAVRPDVIYGQRDRQFIPRAARLFRIGVVPLINGGRSTMAIVHAANVADGAVRAVRCDGAGGRAYNLANDYDVTVADFVRLGATALEKRVLTPSVPRGVAAAVLGSVGTVGELFTGKGLAAHAESTLNFLSRDNPFSSARARAELSWSPPVRPEVGIPEAFRWWKRHCAQAGRGRSGRAH
jgi:nucleoside-diphosphate-sugar epimerase